MRRNYQTDVDDRWTDPELLATSYQLGKNAYFEVQLTLAELEKTPITTGGGSANTSSGSSGGYSGGGGGGGGYYCPEKSQFVWILSDGAPRPVRAEKLVQRTGIRVYNSLTGNFNALLNARLIKNVKLNRISSTLGYGLRCAESHKIVRNTMDKAGTHLFDCREGSEALTFSRDFIVKNPNLQRIDNCGHGDVVELWIEKEFLYVAGEDESGGFLSHNRKNDDPGDGFIFV